MDIDQSLDDIIARGAPTGGGARSGGSARGRGRGRGIGRAPGGRGGGRAPGGRGGGRAPGGRGVGKAPGSRGGVSRGITKRAPSAKAGGNKVVVVGGKPGKRTPRRQAGGQKSVLIGPNTDIKLSAGAVANFLREGTPPVVKAISPANVNNAVKTLALARNYVAEEGLEIYVAVDFPEYDEHSGTANVNLHVFQKQQRSDLSRVLAQMSVSGTSEPGKVAGAIAATAREAVNPKRLCVSCAGPAAMLNALKAIFLARRYLVDDGIDLSVIPEFENVNNGPTLVHLFTLVHAPNATL